MAPGKKFCYDFPRPCVACDVLLISETAEILLIRRKHAPFENAWALPGGFLEMDETAEECASREMQEETGVFITPGEFIPVAVFSAVHRDPRQRVISLSYLGRVRKQSVAPRAGDDALVAGWHRLDALPEMAFDHSEIIQSAKNKNLI